jgi:UDP-2,3-diacylglucosamine pyrophosphatase LpxH
MTQNTLIISDLHIGSRAINHKAVIKLLSKMEFDRLILLGDIIDGWAFNRYRKFSKKDVKIIRKLLKKSEKIPVIWIAGNHDEFIREYIPVEFGNITIVNEYVENGIFYTHGDLYDGVVKLKWLGKLGAIGYELAISIDSVFKALGYKKSISKILKDKTKEVVKFITNFENEIVRQAKKRNCNIAICGHIHKPMDKIIDGVRYINTGDWIENYSYVVQTDTEISLLKLDT